MRVRYSTSIASALKSSSREHGTSFYFAKATRDGSLENDVSEGSGSEHRCSCTVATDSGKPSAIQYHPSRGFANFGLVMS